MRSTWIRGVLTTAALALAGCGGGQVFGDAPTEAPPVDPNEPARIDLFLSSPELPSAANTAAEGVTVTALVRDASNGSISGAQVLFSVNNNAALTAAIVDTGSDGIAQTVVTTGNDATNRTVTITATAGDVTATITLPVKGTTIAMTGPSSTQFQTATAYTITLLGSDSTGLPNQQVTLTSTAPGFSPTTVTTDSTGQATATYTPTTNATSATLTASALGISATKAITISTDSFIITVPTTGQEIDLNTNQTVSVTWTRGTNPVSGATVSFSATRGTLSASTATTNGSGVASVTITSTQAGPVTISASGTDTTPNPDVNVAATRTAEFVATTPANLSLQPDPTTLTVGQQSTLTAVVRDANNNFVKNQVVNFRVASGPGSISPAQATTDSQGIAVASFNATAVSSGQGVEIVAELADCQVPAPPAYCSEPFIEDSATIVVGGAALRLVLGTGNEMFEQSTTTYRLPYTVIVTDSNGTAVPSRTVNLSLHAMVYRKGTSQFFTSWVRTDGSGGSPIDCTNEDLLSTNPEFWLNGILDDPVLEDINGNTRLDPENVGTVPSSVTTDANGIANFDVIYLKDRAYWIRVRLRATTAVGGTESVVETFFDLPGLAEDFNDSGVAPPGLDSPYGVLQDCTADDEAAPTVQFTTAGQTVDEDDGVATGTTVTMAVELDEVSTQDVVVPLFYGGTASSGSDYVSPPTQVTILAGNLTATFDVNLNFDATIESDETILIGLGQPANAKVGTRDVHTIAVTDND